MAEIKITTKFNDEVILQSVDVCDRTRDLPMFGRMDSIMSTVIRLCDQGVRKALKELGWKAPGEESEELRRAKLVVGDLAMLMEARQIEEVEIRKLLVPLAAELGVRRASEHSVGYLVKDVLPLLAAQNRAFQAQLETARKTIADKDAALHAAIQRERGEQIAYRNGLRDGHARAGELESALAAARKEVKGAAECERERIIKLMSSGFSPVQAFRWNSVGGWAPVPMGEDELRAALDGQSSFGGIPVEVDPSLPDNVIAVRQDGRGLVAAMIKAGAPEPTAWICPTPGCGHTITHAEHLVARLDNACPSCFLAALSTFTPTR